MTDSDTSTDPENPETEGIEEMDPGPALPFDVDASAAAKAESEESAEGSKDAAAGLAGDPPGESKPPSTFVTMEPAPAYQVLARKYRPTGFESLIGQEAMVRTLRNAIAQNRVAHAFVLTGVRGIGKTTTARIMARALNCVGPDGTGGPTVTPCGECEHCIAIAGDRHMDVIEMDAASRTGVDDVREIIESVRYAPVSARFKIYIIDEVHMLSRNAFNALLKTLEEPPDHVKFIFATTEIRKLPVTVLSRCQRFDLRRLDVEQLREHFGKIAKQENTEVSEEALTVIARAADGSVRDGLSLLDQAIARAETGAVSADQVRQMLGWADRTQVFDLLEKTLGGNLPAALDQLGEMHAVGADPTVVLQDMLELVHWLTRCRVAPEALAGAAGAALPEAERVRGADLARSLSMPALTRAWQMLLKGLQEAQQAPQPLPAAEMILIRLAYASELPDPATIIRTLRAETGEAGATATSGGVASGGGASGGGAVGNRGSARAAATGSGWASGAGVGTAAATAPIPAAPIPTAEAVSAPVAAAAPKDFEELVRLFQEQGELVIHAHLVNNVHLVQCTAGLLEFRPDDFAPPDLAGSVRVLLHRWTGRNWAVVLSSAPGAPTLAQQRAAEDDARRAAAERHPLIQAVRDVFPGATIDLVRSFDNDGPTPLMEDPEPGDETDGPGLQPGEFGADDDEDLDDWA